MLSLFRTPTPHLSHPDFSFSTLEGKMHKMPSYAAQDAILCNTRCHLVQFSSYCGDVSDGLRTSETLTPDSVQTASARWPDTVAGQVVQ
ncbi:MAG: hypothetical protein IJZ86_02900 [Bacteroides sp.]|nr:hypothetical protein [Bacteroides sp.]